MIACTKLFAIDDVRLVARRLWRVDEMDRLLRTALWRFRHRIDGRRAGNCGAGLGADCLLAKNHRFIEPGGRSSDTPPTREASVTGRAASPRDLYPRDLWDAFGAPSREKP